MSTALLLSVGALALLDTLSPTILGVTVYMLLSERSKVTGRLMVYLGTVACFYFVAGLILMLGLDTITRAISNITDNMIVSRGMFIIGLALLIGSFFVPTKKLLLKCGSRRVQACWRWWRSDSQREWWKSGRRCLILRL